MGRAPVLTKKKRTDPTKALVYCESDFSWGWWCPECTGDNEEPFGRENYSNRGGAQRAAVDHERARHQL